MLILPANLGGISTIDLPEKFPLLVLAVAILSPRALAAPGSLFHPLLRPKHTGCTYVQCQGGLHLIW